MRATIPSAAILLAGLLALGGCDCAGSDDAAGAPPAPAPAVAAQPQLEPQAQPVKQLGRYVTKAEAPVRIEAQVLASEATLELSFPRAAEHVTVEVWGTHELCVTEGHDTIVDRSFARDESVQLRVCFDEPQAACDLAVRVRGEFGGRTMSIVRSFSLVEEQRTRPRSFVDGTGKRVKVMRAETQRRGD